MYSIYTRNRNDTHKKVKHIPFPILMFVFVFAIIVCFLYLVWENIHFEWDSFQVKYSDDCFVVVAFLFSLANWNFLNRINFVMSFITSTINIHKYISRNDEDWMCEIWEIYLLPFIQNLKPLTTTTSSSLCLLSLRRAHKFHIYLS